MIKITEMTGMTQPEHIIPSFVTTQASRHTAPDFISIQIFLYDYEVLSLVNTPKFKWGKQEKRTLIFSMTIQTQ